MELLTDVLLIVLVILVGGLLVHILGPWLRVLKMMTHIPGPRAFPPLGNAHSFIVPQNRILQKFGELVHNNPPLFRLWFGPIPVNIITDPHHLEIVLGSTKHLDKTIAYKLMESWLGTGLLTSTGQKWAVHRKMITPAFHFNILNSFIEVFSDNCKILIKKLKVHNESPGFEITDYIRNCTLDIVCETAMGTKINAQEQDGNIDYIKSMHIAAKCLMKRILSPWLYPDFIYKLTPSGRLYFKNMAVLHGFTDKVIGERKLQRKQNKSQQTEDDEDDEKIYGKKKRKAFLDMMLDACELGSEITDEELREEVDTFMFTGHDTTTSALCWCVQTLGEYPDIQEKAYEEQELIFQGSDRAPTMQELNDMKYLERVIKEVLRLYVIVVAFGREFKEDVHIDGYTLPAGSNFMVLNYFTHRLPEHYPGDPEKFDPDNFLPERVAKRHPYAYIPFSAGPRNCIGQRFAMLEIKTVLSYLLRNYRITSLKERPVIIPELTTKPEGGVQVKISSRLT